MGIERLSAPLLCGHPVRVGEELLVPRLHLELLSDRLEVLLVGRRQLVDVRRSLGLDRLGLGSRLLLLCRRGTRTRIRGRHRLRLRRRSGLLRLLLLRLHRELRNRRGQRHDVRILLLLCSPLLRGCLLLRFGLRDRRVRGNRDRSQPELNEQGVREVLADLVSSGLTLAVERGVGPRDLDDCSRDECSEGRHFDCECVSRGTLLLSSETTDPFLSSKNGCKRSED